MMKLLSILKFSTIFTTVASPATVTKPEANFSILGQGFRTKAEAKKFIDSKSLYYFNDSNNYDIAGVKHDEKSAKNYLFNKHGDFEVSFHVKAISPAVSIKLVFLKTKSKAELINRWERDYCQVVKDYGYMKHVKVITVGSTGTNYTFAEAYDTTKEKACKTAVGKMNFTITSKKAWYKNRLYNKWVTMENVIWKDHKGTFIPWYRYKMNNTNVIFELEPQNSLKDAGAIREHIRAFWTKRIIHK